MALEQVRDPDNLGTVDSAGASGIILVGATTDACEVEAVRATTGSTFNGGLARASR